MEEIYWECFFNNAGIGGISSREYADIFVKNKISDSLLVHLNENYLKSMSIYAIGDIIRILKYTKDYLDKKNKPHTTVRETKEILPLSDLFVKKDSFSNEMLVTSSYSQPSWFHNTEPFTRIIVPNIEYPITYPHCPTFIITDKVPQRDIHPVLDDTDETDRIVILSDNSQLNDNKTSVLKRLGQSLDRYSQSSSSDDDDDGGDDDYDDKEYNRHKEVKKQKLETPDNKTLLRRFFNASLSRDSTTNIHLSKKITISEKTGKIRTDNDYNEESLPYIGVFKTPNTEKKSGIKVRRGQTTEHLHKVEATSTTECGSLKSDSIAIGFKSRHVMNRLGNKC